MTDDRASHWNDRYSGGGIDRLSWFEASPVLSLSLIRAAVGPEAGVIDVGGGASRLPDALLEAGFDDVTVLDLSQEALEQSQARLGARGAQVAWQVADITRWQPTRLYHLWHDRAVFHFLTTREDREAYADRLTRALTPGGTLILMTFAEDGPEACSGLPVRRYSPEALAREIESLVPGQFSVVDTGRFTHHTPGGAGQKFQYSVFRKVS